MIQAPATNPDALGIDEVPTQPSAFKSLVVSIATVMLASLGIAFWHYGGPAYLALLENNIPAVIHLEDTDLYGILPWIFKAFGIVGAACGVAGILSLIRHIATYHLLRVTLFAVYPLLLGYMVLVWLTVFSVIGAGAPINGGEMDRGEGVVYWWGLSWPALAAGVYTYWLHAMVWSRPVYAAFCKQQGPAMAGDRALEDWRTGGRDPRARRSFFASFATHITILIIIPFLLGLRGCVEGYRLPDGSGQPEVVVQAVVQPQERKKKTITVRPNSPILFDMEELLDETEVDRQMDSQTQARYEVDPSATSGALGADGGEEGGWPEGTEDGRIRFIRISHGGRGWDDGMGPTQADANFLRHFSDRTGLRRVASAGEHYSISDLSRFGDEFPPFIYMTGNGGFRLSGGDQEDLLEYLLGGGMLIADAGHRDFGSSFETLMRQMFPRNAFVDIANDELIYQLPHRFPNGAPTLWSHYGSRPRGIRHEGRWVVFFHPGDMNDAWKSSEYNGNLDPQVREQSLNLGINLIFYSFTQWNNAIAEQQAGND